MYKFLKDKTVLYVEDEAPIRQSVTELIADYFKRFDTASSAEEGYEKFLEGGYDIIISDIELPKMSGLDMFAKIRKTDKKIHLVIISAHSKVEYLLNSISFKLEQYLIKPLNSKKIKELLSILNEVFADKSVTLLAPNIILNQEKSTLIVEQEERPLTKKELGILSILAQKKVVTYDEIDLQWEDEPPSQNAVRSCIKKLRQKLPIGVLKTRSGVGYYI